MNLINDSFDQLALHFVILFLSFNYSLTMKFKNHRSVVVLLFAGIVSVIFLLDSCKHDEIPVAKFAPVPFSDIKPIFQNYCGTCHNGNGTRNSRLNLNDSIGILRSVIPYNVSKSKAYQAMISTFQIMPPKIALPTSKRTLIRLWIEQGASPN